MSTLPISQPSMLSRARAPFEAAIDRARLTVVPHRRRVRAPRMPFVTLVSVVLLGGIIGLLCFNTQMQQASFTATTLEDRAASLSAREQTLHSELQELRDPQHLAVLAAKAGMVAPQGYCTLKLGTRATDTCTGATRGSTPPPFGPPPAKPAEIDPRPIIHTVQATPGWGPDTGSDTGNDTGSDTGRR